MNQKQRQRVGSAIASTILSYAALSLVGVDKAQAAVLTYNFQVAQGGGGGFFKLSNSSLTKTGLEALAVSEGRFNTLTASASKNYYDLAGAIAFFFQGEFRGLQASGGDREIRALGGHYYTKYDRRAFWQMNSGGSSPGSWTSYFSGYSETIIWNYERAVLVVDRTIINDAKVSYTLVDTAAEPVPEPVTVAGTGLALAGLSWLKHKKKMAA